MRTNRLKVAYVPAVKGNPYLEILASHLAEHGVEVSYGNLGWILGRFDPALADVDVVHIHWLGALLGDPRPVHLTAKLIRFGLSLAWLRLGGKKIVWTVHNLYAHERAHMAFDRYLRRWVGRCANVVLTHCENARRQVAEDYGRGWVRKIAVVPHGHFIDVYPNDVSKTEARERLGIDEDVLVFLFFGQIRDYKGIPELIDAFDRLGGGTSLIIAGMPRDGEIGSRLTDRVGSRHDVRLRLGFIPHDEIQVFMNACDAVVLPYRDVLTSGGAILAMSFGRACVAPRMGCIQELVDARGAFLYDTLDDQGLYKAMQRAVDAHEKLVHMGQHNRAEIERLSWPAIAKKTAELYRQCLYPGGSRRTKTR